MATRSAVAVRQRYRQPRPQRQSGECQNRRRPAQRRPDRDRGCAGDPSGGRYARDLDAGAVWPRPNRSIQSSGRKRRLERAARFAGTVKAVAFAGLAAGAPAGGRRSCPDIPGWRVQAGTGSRGTTPKRAVGGIQPARQRADRPVPGHPPVVLSRAQDAVEPPRSRQLSGVAGNGPATHGV